jgi:putative CocE/NonD family hydrolase
LSVLLLIPTGNDQALAVRVLKKTKADQAKGELSVYHPPAVTHHFKQTSQYLKMSDGTRLAVDVYLPNSCKPGDKLPTIVEESRYWRVIEPRRGLTWLYPKPLSLYRYEFITRGYAWVVADARGAGSSFGDRPWEMPPIDAQDSKELLNWVVAQPWCNGKLGLIGHSYSGNMAEFALMSKNPAVKAAAVLSSPFDIYTDVLRPGGIPLLPFAHQWAALNKNFDQNKLPNNIRQYSIVLRGSKPVDGDKHHTLLKQAVEEHKRNNNLSAIDKINFRDDSLMDGDEQHTATFEKCIALLKEKFGDDFVTRGLENLSPSGYWKDINDAHVPIYAGGGWLDGGNQGAAVKRFINYTTPGNKLILGPWDHCYFNISPFTRGGFSRFRTDREMLKFFDEHVRGLHSLDHDAPVHYYTLGEEKWHGSQTWPPETKQTTLYLSAEHKLLKDAPAAGGELYGIDPLAGTGHNGRFDCLLGNVILSPYPNRKAEDKRLIVFDSDALTSDMIVTGHPAIKIFLKPNGKDCTLFAYLEDVSASGSVSYVSEGEVLCGNRLNSIEPQLYKTVVPTRSFRLKDYHPLTPGKVVEVDLDMFPMSYQFKKGHHIRLALAGGDKDHFQKPNFTQVSAEFEVKWGTDCPSQIQLPVDQSGGAILE